MGFQSLLESPYAGREKSEKNLSNLENYARKLSDLSIDRNISSLKDDLLDEDKEPKELETLWRWKLNTISPQSRVIKYLVLGMFMYVLAASALFGCRWLRG